MNMLEKLSIYSGDVLRFGLGIVILWFGLNEVTNVEAWVSYVPSWASFGFPTTTIVYANGIFEIIAGSMLILGIFTRLVSLVLFLHMVVIVYDIGLTAIGMRDFGLAAALLSLSLKKDE